MGKFSPIGWTDHTWNGWIGCQKISPGCQFCYAEHETFVRRERSHGRELWGPQGTRHRTSEEYWKQPLRWNNEVWWECRSCGWRGRLDSNTGCPVCGESAFKSARQRVFCMSLADVLEDRPELVPWRNDLFNLIDQTPNLDWLLLSKRIDMVSYLLPFTWFDGEWPANVWMGISVEDKRRGNERIPYLLRCPAPVRFLSIEPMLEPIDLYHIHNDFTYYDVLGKSRFDYGIDGLGVSAPMPSGVDWVIVGGESGKKCRPFNWDWARTIRSQCATHDIPFFMKQGGGYPDKCDDLESIPEDLRVREWPR